MKKLVLAGTALAVIGFAAGGIAVSKAGAQPDPAAAVMMAPHDAQAVGMPMPPRVDADDADPELSLQALAGAPQPMDGDGMELAQAGPPPAAGPGTPPPPPPPGMPGRPGPDGMRAPRPMGGPMQGGWHRPMWHRANMFGLFYRLADKQLTTADVQKIAEAFLLWQGNRDWKVTQVAAGPDGKIGFAFATSDGGVIARFTMDSRTGRLARVG